MQTSLCIMWINNKVLLYITESYIQHPMINHNGKEYKKECVCVYVCVIESLCRSAEIKTYKSTIYTSVKKKKRIDQVSASCPAILSHHIHLLAQNWIASMSAFQFAGKN